jgi:hypothetical protein
MDIPKLAEEQTIEVPVSPSSAAVHMRSKRRKKSLVARVIKLVFVTFTAFVLAGGLFGYLFLYQPAMKVKEDAIRLRSRAAEMKVVFSQNDIDLIATKTAEIRRDFDTLKQNSQPFRAFAFVPQVQDYFAALEAADYLLIAGTDAIIAIEPYADLIGFKKGKSNFFEKTAEERLETAVLTLDKLVDKIDPIAENLDKAKTRIDTIDPNDYPEEFQGVRVREQIQSAKDQFDGIHRLVVNAKPFLKELPAILGKDKKKRYLVIFQNDKERRATGGFWTGTTELSIEKGRLIFDKVTNIYDIDAGVRPAAAPRALAKYFPAVNGKMYLRDSNLSPDLVESIKLFESVYATYGNKAEYDGIFFIDTKILVDMLEIFGDTTADGVTFSAKIDRRCNCPSVIYELSDRIGRPVGYVKTERKAILGSLLRELLFKAIGFSPSRYWGRLVQAMLVNMDEKHIMLYFTDPRTQAAAEKMGWAGRIIDTGTNIDYLHINTVNFGGQKANLFVQEEVESQTLGTRREVRIVFKNPFKGSDCNLERGGLCLNAPLRNWIRFYVPKGSRLIDFKGSQTKVETYDELGKTVFEGFLVVNPLGKADVFLAYELPASTKTEELLIQKQGGVQNQMWKVYLEGVKKFDGELFKDVVIK